MELDKKMQKPLVLLLHEMHGDSEKIDRNYLGWECNTKFEKDLQTDHGHCV